MIKYRSNLEVCQLELLQECEKIKSLLNLTESEFLESVNKDDFPLQFAPNLYYLHERLSKLFKELDFITEKIKGIG